MNKKPLVLGITGQMGSGKSTVARMFNEKFKIPVYHADTEAKKIMHREDLRKKIEEEFGKESYRNNRLNTGYLSKIVFYDKNKLKKLESIVHPEVKKDFLKWKEKHEISPFVILENAILYESGMDQLCDLTLLVKTDKKYQMERIKNRDGLTEKEIEARLKHQTLQEKIIKKVNFIINNNQDLDTLFNKVQKIHAKIEKLIK